MLNQGVGPATVGAGGGGGRGVGEFKIGGD